MSDALHKFLFDGEQASSPVRGEIVALAATWTEIRSRHDFPPPVLEVLGELVAASTLLTANLKFNGALIMQIHGDGPVSLLVVECHADLTLRATAKLAEDAEIGEADSFLDLVNPGGTGRFVITLDPKDRLPGQQPYQGMVPLEGESVSEVLQNYMLRSEQLDTKLWLAADDKRAAGVLLQRLPLSGGPNASAGEVAQEAAHETWNRAVTFAETLKRDELLQVEPADLMRRLFWEETLRVFEPIGVSFRCSCSRERVAGMLVTLGREEVEETLEEQGSVQVQCEFCNRQYEFDAVDCAQLFATNNTADGVRAPQIQRH